MFKALRWLQSNRLSVVGVAAVVACATAFTVGASRRGTPTVTDTVVKHQWHCVPCDKLGNDPHSRFYTREPRLWESLASLRKGEDHRDDWDGVLFVTDSPTPANARLWPADMQASRRGQFVYGDPVMVRAYATGGP